MQSKPPAAQPAFPPLSAMECLVSARTTPSRQHRLNPELAFLQPTTAPRTPHPHKWTLSRRMTAILDALRLLIVGHRRSG